jgi:electron transfer flavoprotein alpha subunit
MKIWTFVEHRDGEVDEVSYQILRCARSVADKLGGEVTAVLIGAKDLPIEEIKRRGPDKVLISTHDLFNLYPIDSAYTILCSLLSKYKPDLFFVGHTPTSMCFIPKIASNLGIGLVSCCINLKIVEEKDLVFVREICNGKLHVDITLKTPLIATFLPGCFPAMEEMESSAEIIEEPVSLDESKLKVKLIKKVRLMEEVDISRAKIIVCGGRGLKDSESFINLIQRLANLLGAELAGTRPTRDYGWIQPERLVGISGKTVKPQLYIAIGVSGAIQHLSGVKGCRCLIAINKDPDAPIFRFADYGIVNDLFKVVPAIIEELQKTS